MYNQLEISHFRAFSHLEVKSLSRINLIAGDNNVGKTGVLEAIFLAHAESTKQLQSFPSLFRRTQLQDTQQNQDTVDNFWLWLFHQRNTGKPWAIKLQSSINTQVTGTIVELPGGGKQTGLLLNYRQDSVKSQVDHVGLSDKLQLQVVRSQRSQPVVTSISTRFPLPADDAELVNAVAVRNEEDELIEYLQLVEPRLKKLKYLKLPGHKFPYVYADIGFGRGKDLIPATQLGQGFSRLLSLFATILVSKTNILLIDEIENGLQHDALAPIWKSLGKVARDRNIQIFATTHSYECIQAAHQAEVERQDNGYDLGVIKLQRPTSNGEVEAVVLDREQIDTALERNLEVR
jgi:hypothetical protein